MATAPTIAWILSTLPGASALEQYGEIIGFVSDAGAEIENVRSCGVETPDGPVGIPCHRMLNCLPMQGGE